MLLLQDKFRAGEGTGDKDTQKREGKPME